MKRVEFTRDMTPHRAGDTRIVPDSVANRMVANGSGTNPRQWPEKPAASPPQTYRTKKAAKAPSAGS